MAKRKIIRRTHLQNYFAKSEFWIGVATMLVVFTLLSRLPLTGFISDVKSYRVMIVKVTPVPKKTTTTLPLVHPVIAQPKPLITNYTVQEGDSYYTATLKVCGDGTYYTYNQELNSGESLQIGQSIQIRCRW